MSGKAERRERRKEGRERERKSVTGKALKRTWLGETLKVGSVDMASLEERHSKCRRQEERCRGEIWLRGGTVKTQLIWGNQIHGGIIASDCGLTKETGKGLLRHKKHRP